MKIKTESKKVPIVILVTVLVLGLGVCTVYAASCGVFTSKTSSGDSAGKAESDKEQSENIENNPENKNSSPNTDQPAHPTEDSNTHKNTVQVVASVDVTDAVYIRGGANYPITEEGTCYALLSGPTGQSIRKDTVILQNPASTDCRTITIRLDELSSGNWSATLHYSSANYEGSSNAVAFTIN